MPKSVVFVHGYSVRSLNAYGMFPDLLKAEGFEAADIILSAFDSLDNSVTCDDLALGLEDRVADLEAQGLDVADSAFVVHSTGAIITRRWILNRLDTGKDIPSHFISIAGANHGSTLAQLGFTMYNRLIKTFQGANGVGQQILTDLDYGSAFLLRLNLDWLQSLNSGKLAKCYSFSMIGDDHTDNADQIIWRTKENGSDSTVRICGGNLNYTWLSAAPGEPDAFIATAPAVESPHLVIHGLSHTGDKGIIDSVRNAGDPSFAALMEALRVEDEAGYGSVRDHWKATTTAWNQGNIAGCSSMLAFHLQDEAARPIPDSFIIISDASGSAGAVSPSLQNRQPIQNKTDGSSVSFYVQYAKFTASEPHLLHIESRSTSPLVDYKTIDYAVSAQISSLVRPNETTYIDVILEREARNAYRLIPFSSSPNMTAEWPPLPPQ